MEKKNNDTLKEILTAISAFICVTAFFVLVIFPLISYLSKDTHKASAFATEDNDPYYTWLAGCEMNISQTPSTDVYGETVWTDCIPLPSKLSNKAEDSIRTYSLYEGNSQSLYQEILTNNEFRLRVFPLKDPDTYIQDIRILNNQTQLVAVDYFVNSLQNTTAGIKTSIYPSNGLNSTFFLEMYDFDKKEWITFDFYRESRVNTDGNFYIVEPVLKEVLRNAFDANNATVITEDGVSVAYVRKIEWRLERIVYPDDYGVLGLNENDTFTIWNFYQRDGVTDYRYIQLLNSFKPDNVNLSWNGKTSLYGFVDEFFSFEIFPGFSFGTLLFIGIGGLLVGMLLKIFLGG